MTDKITARILVIALTFLAAIGLMGTLYLIATNPNSTQISVFVALAGVPIGAVAALATTKNTQPQTDPVVIPGPPGPTGPAGEKGEPGNVTYVPSPIVPTIPTDIWASSSTDPAKTNAESENGLVVDMTVTKDWETPEIKPNVTVLGGGI